MNQQNQNPPRHVPTAEEIARLEAEAVAALQRGEAPQAAEGAPAPEQVPEQVPEQAPAAPAFVPYVDDAPPAPKPARPAGEDGDVEADVDDDEYIPGEWEKRIDALTPKQWRTWQILGGGAVGLAVVAALFVFGQELATYGLIVAALLAILLPRYLERAWRRKLTTARYAMIVTMVIGLAVMAVLTGIRTGFVIAQPKP